MERVIISFYHIFHGILFFQVAIFLYLYFSSKKKEYLYFSLFLLLLGINFFLNSTGLYGLTDHDTFMYSAFYNFVNTPLVITANICYCHFLKAFYKGFANSKLFFKILDRLLVLLWIVLLLFVVLYIFGIISNLLFNILHVIGIAAGIWLVVIILRDKLPYKKFMASAFISNLAGTLLTICMLLLQNTEEQHLLVRQYPYIFIQVGLLIEIFFFNMAMLNKWIHLEKKSVVLELEGQLEVEKLRNKISGQLHDDIGSTLSGISMHSHLTQTMLQNGNYDLVKDAVSIIQRSANEVINKLGDLVWAIKPDNDSFTRMIDKIQQYGYEMCNTKNIRFESTIENVTDLPGLALDVKQHIYLILKEAINNAVKYSNADTIEFYVQPAGSMLEMIVSDNGKGFDPGNVKKGNGLGNMQKRADEAGAAFSIRSRPGNGSIIQVTYRIPQ